jgi:recombination protein RecT
MTQMVKYEDKVKSVRSLLERSKSQMQMALPRHMNADRLARIAMTTVQRVPKLLECTPQSFIGAVIQCAQLGLEPDDIRGSAYLVPFRNNKKGTMEVQLIAGYKGLLELARRSAQVSTIEARSVYEKDHFDFEYGLDAKLHHIPHSGPQPGEITHFYAIGRLRDGGKQFEVMTRQEVEEIRDRYSKAKNEGPWVTNFREMGLKTVLRRLAKLLPTSPELATAVALDEMHESGIPQDLTFSLEESPETPEKPDTKLDQLAKTIQPSGHDGNGVTHYEADLLAVLQEIETPEGVDRLWKQHEKKVLTEMGATEQHRIKQAFDGRKLDLTQKQGKLV